ncbi:hypothetical protein AKI39_18365 [Bordetella sp. H567]|uniref:glycoside hydrolase family 15 protein n=1 Tax=Bordetella sp. H567 TaxID=1697043 RepID=UPI00081C6E71|nr:glycoside hydrolase family 15 protein [Bordetella sp. H567]AOB32261.1 hypothetical protein AKI39_18365 [Bordetella sp. H567]
MAARIEDYALLGDGASAALVSRDGSIDWLCWPSFSGDALFAALLGHAANGCWRIAPRGEITTASRRYLPGTMVLETRLATAEGEAVLLDWMAWNTDHPLLLRRVRCTWGRVRLDFELQVCRDYGRHPAPGVSIAGKDIPAWSLDDEHLAWLQGAPEPPGEDGGLRAEFRLAAGSQRDFVLGCHPARLPAPAPVDASAVLRDTVHAWRRWQAKGNPQGPYAEVIQHSLMVLKTLGNVRSGGLIAAPTSSLPEQAGGSRNWDYRYCWIRDASFTMQALILGGYRDEAAAWRDWLVGAISTHPSQLRVLYDVSGGPAMKEWECPWLPGYGGSRPVRFGNGAAAQLQLDVYGEVLNALYVSRKHGLPPDADAWELEKRLVDHLGEIWREPDNGFWEVRGERRHFTTSKVMMWVAVDRAMRSAREFAKDAPLHAWHALAERIRGDVLEHGVDARRQLFTSSYGSTALDASLLIIPLSGFLPVADPRVANTIRALETHLMRDGLLYRYDPAIFQDGAPGHDHAFLACSLWLVQVRAMQGRRQEAQALYERILALRNDLGLLAEQYDPSEGRLWGNYPQALSHVALVNAAFMLQGDGPLGP